MKHRESETSIPMSVRNKVLKFNVNKHSWLEMAPIHGVKKFHGKHLWNLKRAENCKPRKTYKGLKMSNHPNKSLMA